MYICRGHFLSPYVVAIVDGKPLQRMLSVDTNLMVAQRLVGYDPDDGTELTDLVKVDEILFVSNNMPANLTDLIPDGFSVVKAATEDGAEVPVEK